MLSHENFLATVRMYDERLGLDRTHSLYQFLPLAHVLARVAQAVVLSVGARDHLLGRRHRPDRRRAAGTPVRPTSPPCRGSTRRCTAPSPARSRARPALQRALFEWALRCGARARRALRERRQPDLLTDVQYRLADRLVLAKVRRLFGPELQLALVGAAPVAPELLEFFDACGVLVLEGYGLSETCAAATLNTADALRFGTVGQAAARHRGRDRRRRRDPDPRPPRVQGLLPRSRGHRGGADRRRVASFGRPRRDRARMASCRSPGARRI